MTMSEKNKSVAATAKKKSPNMKETKKFNNEGESSSNNLIASTKLINANDIKTNSVSPMESEIIKHTHEEFNGMDQASMVQDEIKENIMIELLDEEVIEVDGDLVHDKNKARKELENPGSSAQVKSVDPKYAVLAALGLVPITPLLTKVDTFIKSDDDQPAIIPISIPVDETNDNLKDIKLQCQKCDTYFSSKATLRAHCVDKHKSVMSYYCKICSVLFLTRTSLLKHKLKQHNGQKPYTCTMCPLNFVCLGALTAHVRRHNGKLPYICKVCKKGFQYYNDLQEHGRVHELKMIVSQSKKTFICDICNRAFCKPSDLSRHYRVHTGEKPFACSVCGNKFQQTHNLTKHMHIHTKEHTYECDLCKRIFYRPDVLNRHMLTHALQKPFQCDFCDLSFTRAKQLRDHFANRHADENIVQALEDLKAKSKSRKFDNTKFDIQNKPQTSNTNLPTDKPIISLIISDETSEQTIIQDINTKSPEKLNKSKQILLEKAKENSLTDILSIVDKSMFAKTYKNKSKPKIATTLENALEDSIIDSKIVTTKSNKIKLEKSATVLLVDSPQNNETVLENKTVLIVIDNPTTSKNADENATISKINKNKLVQLASSSDEKLIKKKINKSNVIKGNKRKLTQSVDTIKDARQAKIIKTGNEIENNLINVKLMKQKIIEKSNKIEALNAIIKDSTEISNENILEATRNTRKLRKPTYEEEKQITKYPKVASVKIIKKGVDTFTIKTTSNSVKPRKAKTLVDSEKLIGKLKTKKTKNKPENAKTDIFTKKQKKSKLIKDKEP